MLLPTTATACRAGTAQHGLCAAAPAWSLFTPAVAEAVVTAERGYTGGCAWITTINAVTCKHQVLALLVLLQAMALPRPLPIPRPTAFPAAPHMVPQPRLAGSTGLASGPPLPPRAYASPMPSGQPYEARPVHIHAVLPGSGAVGLTNPPSMPGLPPPMPSDKAGLPTASRPGALAGNDY